MNNKKAFSLHFVCLISVFLLGNLIITMHGFSIFTALALPIGCLLLFFPISFLTKKAKSANCFFRYFVCIIFISFSLFIAANCAKDFILFAKAQILPECHKWLLSLVFSVVLYAFIKLSNRAALKFALLSFFAISFILTLFFVLSLKGFQAENPMQIKADAVSVIKVILPLSVPIVYLISSGFPVRPAKVFSGAVLGAGLLTIAFLNAALIFGRNAIADMHFPYADAVSTVSVGSLFTRMDGFAYFIFFFCTCLKSGISIKCARTLFEKSEFRHINIFDFSAALFVFFFCLNK